MKILLLGAISPFCDLAKEINKLNIDPIVCDYYSDAPAKTMGFKSYNVSTTDVESLLEIARKEDIDGVICAFSDRNLMPSIDICDRLGLKYFFSKKLVEQMTDKQKMKSLFKSYAYPVVKYEIIDVENINSICDNFTFPVIIKPIDAYGSKGIFKCDNIDSVIENVKFSLKESLNYDDKILIEEFYDSDEISISGFVVNGRAFVTCVYDVFRNIEDIITLSAVAFPSKYSNRDLTNFTVLLNKIVHSFGIKEGPVTLQCFIGNKGIMVSELLCRLAGGSPYLYPTYFGGPNVAKMIIQNAVGQKVDYQNLEDFIPCLCNYEVFFDIQILIRSKGKILYEIEKELLRNRITEIVDIVVYYSNESELINVGKAGVVFAKVFCKQNRQDDYYKLIKKIDDEIAVYNEYGEKVSFIRIPKKINVVDMEDIDWEFLEKYDCK